MRDVLLYSLLRLVLIGGLWWLLDTVTPYGFYLSGLMAILIATLLSIVLLRRPRDAAAKRWQASDERRRATRVPRRDEDADEEDELLEDAEGSRVRRG
ncbi:DUF4229 domain-containing protein [Brachybacterium huguangmaarense]